MYTYIYIYTHIYIYINKIYIYAYNTYRSLKTATLAVLMKEAVRFNQPRS